MNTDVFLTDALLLKQNMKITYRSVTVTNQKCANLLFISSSIAYISKSVVEEEGGILDLRYILYAMLWSG